MAQWQTTVLLSRCRVAPYQHQIIGISKLVAHPVFALFDEMGAGKTLQVIVAAQILFVMGLINRVIVIAPASVKGVWFDKDLGELAKHLWLDLPGQVSEYHAKIRKWTWGVDDVKPADQLRWIVTNYEFLRAKTGQKYPRVVELLSYCGPRTLLVLDESSAVKNRGANQTRACMALRKACGRVILLNGTPIANNPLDMLSQGNLMDPGILECKYVTMFRDRYAVMARHNRFPQIVGWKNLDDLQQRFAPYVLRRLKKDCLDLPEKLPAVTLTATLSDKTWKVYKEMRDEMVAWLSSDNVSVAGQAVTRALRLAQITSGFLGGVEAAVEAEIFAPDPPVSDGKSNWSRATSAHQIIGQEKLDLVLSFFKEQLQVDPNLKLLIWCRFRPELLRLIEAFKLAHPNIAGDVGLIIGAQKKPDREHALRLLDPRTAPAGPVVVGGTYGTGSKGLNLTASHTVINCSYDYSLEKFLQSADRVHRPGQIHPVSYFDIVAVGPSGQKTIDHDVVKARRNKEDVATRTQEAWLSALSED